MRQPTRLSPSVAYGLPEATVAKEASRAPSGALPLLLLLVVALAAATVWFVALPALARSSSPARSCEVVVLRSGTTKCVRDPGQALRRPQRKAATGAR
ncbi:MAG: hypothetical protein M5U27_06340 [Gaiella sp.]|nr:hypothetical protein [Gaiella sp.]